MQDNPGSDNTQQFEMSWIACTMTQYPRGTVSLGVVLRSVAIASWTDNYLAAAGSEPPRNYVATLANDEEVQAFCTRPIRIRREPDVTQPAFPRHFEVRVRVEETGKELTAFVPSDPVRMFGSLELAELMTAGVVKVTRVNQHVEVGESVNIDVDLD